MNWSTNLPPGCSSSDIERRGDPDVDANDIVEETCDHDWKEVDASFDHEFGTEKIFYRECTKCGETTHATPYQQGDEEI